MGWNTERPGLNAHEEQIVREIFGVGCKDPYPDELQDAVADWLDSAAMTYLKARRNAAVLVPLVSQLALLLVRIRNVPARFVGERPYISRRGMLMRLPARSRQ